MRIYSKFLVIFLLLVISIWSYLWYVDQPTVRYSLLHCYYDEIYKREGSIDVLVVGSSRTKQAISAELISDYLSANNDRPVSVANLARSWRGNGQLYRQIKDTYENRGINKAIIVELSSFNFRANGSTLYYAGYYPNYELVVKTSDFLEDFRSTKREPLISRFRVLLSQIIVKIDKSFSVLVGTNYRKILNKKNAASKKAELASTCFTKDNKLRPKTLKTVENKIAASGKTWTEQKPTRWNLNSLNEDRPLHYLRKIRKFAEEKNLKLLFMIVPRYLDSPIDSAFKDQVQTITGVSLIEPTVKIREIMNDQGYTDPSHMALHGRNTFSKWLATRIKLDVLSSKSSNNAKAQ